MRLDVLHEAVALFEELSMKGAVIFLGVEEDVMHNLLWQTI